MLVVSVLDGGKMGTYWLKYTNVQFYGMNNPLNLTYSILTTDNTCMYTKNLLRELIIIILTTQKILIMWGNGYVN